MVNIVNGLHGLAVHICLPSHPPWKVQFHPHCPLPKFESIAFTTWRHCEGNRMNYVPIYPLRFAGIQCTVRLLNVFSLFVSEQCSCHGAVPWVRFPYSSCQNEWWLRSRRCQAVTTPPSPSKCEIWPAQKNLQIIMNIWMVVKMLVPEFGGITPFTMRPASKVSCGPTILSF